MTARLAAALLAFALASPALAADLDPKLAAKIKRDQKKAFDDIAKEHGNKKTSQMSGDERREVVRQQSDAAQAVLDKNGVSAKDYARYTGKLSREDQKEMAAAEKELEAKEEADKAAAEKKKPEEIKVQRGFSNANPIEMEAKEGAPPIVEHGLPKDER